MVQVYLSTTYACHDLAEWLRNNFKGKTEVMIVGPIIKVSNKANPSPSLQIIEISQLRDLFNRVRSMFNAVEAADKSDIGAVFQSWLNHYGLNWPICVESFESRLAVDLKS